MSTSNSQRPPPRGLKRQRLTNPTPSPPLPTLNKKRKSFNLATEALTAFWDSLPKVYLTPSALKEFDRRTRLRGRIAIEGPSGLRSGKTAELATQLRRACRQGGLDLGHLRGVRYCPIVFSKVELTCRAASSTVFITESSEFRFKKWTRY